MGSYNRFFVSVSTTDTNLIKAIINDGREFDKTNSGSPTWDQYCFGKWSESTKWDPSSLILKLSKQFPTIIFSISYQGDWGSGKTFFNDGEEINECDVYPKRPAFPPMIRIKKAVLELKKRRAEEVIAREKEAAAREAAEKEARIKKLEEELKTLKSHKAPLAPMDI